MDRLMLVARALLVAATPEEIERYRRENEERLAQGKQRTLEEIKKSVPKPPNATDEQYEKTINEVYESVIKADPVAAKSKGKKIPYVPLILKWLRKGTVRLPEDADKIAEMFTLLKEAQGSSQASEVKDVSVDPKTSEFDSPAAIKKFLIKHGEIESDQVQDATDVEVTGGIEETELWPKLKEVASHGAFKLYKLDKAKDWPVLMQTPSWNKTSWCVIKKPGMYEGPYYLVRYKDRIFALLEEYSQQIKAVDDHLPDTHALKAMAPLIKHVWPEHVNQSEATLEKLIDDAQHHAMADLPLLDFLFDFKNKPTQIRMTQHLLCDKNSSDLDRASPYVYSSKPSDLKDVVARLNDAIDKKDQKLFMIVAYYANENGLWNKVKGHLKSVARTDPYLAVLYSYIVGMKFESAENVIMKDPTCAADYALFIMKKRWPEAEETIKQNPKAWRFYQREAKRLGDPVPTETTAA